jgi:nucleoside-diphosphate-sugar epimerase
MKNVLVTGANGFIGRALCERLLSDGYRVWGAVRKGRAAELTPGVQTVEIDAIDAETDWSLALQDIDTVVHLAARVHRMKDQARDPFAAYQEVNVHGTERLAKAAVSAGVERFVFLSTVKVNGEENVRPYRETDKPFPKDSYAISKIYD